MAEADGVAAGSSARRSEVARATPEAEEPARGAKFAARGALSLSVFIIALNEADRIGDVIRSVGDLATDLLVVDSGSRDGTVELARSLGARVLHRDWDGYGPQKRFAEEQCRNDWLLNLDADEVVSPELAAEIRRLFADGPDRDAYRIGIAETFPGEVRPHRWAYTLTPVRPLSA